MRLERPMNERAPSINFCISTLALCDCYVTVPSRLASAIRSSFTGAPISRRRSIEANGLPLGRRRTNSLQDLM
jgi:hypothetical protein